MGQIHHHHKAKEKPHDKLDRFMYTLAFVGPIMTIPQITQIWVDGKFEGVSLLSWSTYLCLSAIWMWYGIVRKEKPLILSNLLYLVVNIIVVSGLVIAKT
ncbi:MAG: hypothetical protein ACMG6E_00270 [Candidatus Roizmanbacteria bacterium]